MTHKFRVGDVVTFRFGGEQRAQVLQKGIAREAMISTGERDSPHRLGSDDGPVYLVAGPPLDLLDEDYCRGDHDWTDWYREHELQLVNALDRIVDELSKETS